MGWAFEGLGQSLSTKLNQPTKTRSFIDNGQLNQPTKENSTSTATVLSSTSTQRNSDAIDLHFLPAIEFDFSLIRLQPTSTSISACCPAIEFNLFLLDLIDLHSLLS